MNLDHTISDREHRLKTRIHSPSIHERSVPENALEGVEGLFAGNQAPGNLPVVGIEFASGGGARPHDGDETHSQRDGTDSVICKDRNQRLALCVCK